MSILLLLHRHRHAEGDGPFAALDVSAEVEPTSESMDRTGFNAANEALEHCKKLVARAVAPEPGVSG